MSVLGERDPLEAEAAAASMPPRTDEPSGNTPSRSPNTPCDDLYSGPPVAPEDILSVYVVINGPLGMSPGKTAAQTFHAGRRFEQVRGMRTDAWYGQGKRVVVRVAETPHIFQRVVDECAILWGQRDEGLTEVPHGAITCVVTAPYVRSEVPQILRHKRCQLL